MILFEKLLNNSLSLLGKGEDFSAIRKGLVKLAHGLSQYDAWAVIKEEATFLFRLHQDGFTPEPNWESAVNTLWSAAGAYGKGSWTT